MRKFTDLIKENESLKVFNYTVKISAQVDAANEGEAGYLIDQEIDKIDRLVDYDIENIEDSNETPIQENNDNILKNEEDLAHEIYRQIVDFAMAKLDTLSQGYRELVLNRLVDEFDIIDMSEPSDIENLDKDVFKYYEDNSNI